MINSAEKLAKAAAVQTFGDNMDCALKLLKSSIDSLAVRTDLNKRILFGYKLGEGNLTEDRIKAISSELGVDVEILTSDHGDDEQRQSVIKVALAKSGRLTDLSEPKKVEVRESLTTTESARDMVDLLPAWSEDDFQVKLDKISYDLTSKTFRADLMGHVRAAKGSLSYKEVNQRTGLGKPSSWWSSVEKGISRITRDEIEKISKALDVSVQVLLTGQGLDPAKKYGRTYRSVSLVPIKRVIELPPQSVEARSLFFRDRVLNANTEAAEGVSIGQLLELARNQDKVDWESSWLELTKHGETISKYIAQQNEKLDKLAPTIQSLIIERLCARFKRDE